jgi:tyrosinase
LRAARQARRIFSAFEVGQFPTFAEQAPQMSIQIDIAGMDAQGRIFLTWAPVQAAARIVGGANADVAVVLKSAGTSGGVVFDTARTDQGASNLEITLPASGQPVSFWIAGEFGKPSSDYGDAMVQATDKTTGEVLGSRPAMVRIRKNADTLSPPERDRFLTALATLNALGQGAYRDFREMHVNATTREMHGNVGFLPWHRAFVLDLERALQRIDASVAVPYWRFDQAAPNVFTSDFMGEPNGVGAVHFRPGHPLQQWVTDGSLGITRQPEFDLGGPANVDNDETATLALGDVYADFRDMEGDPHGSAHTSFTAESPISAIPTAVRDPLFFMLHANVDRLWAKWQQRKNHANSEDPGAFAAPSPNRIGHRLGDTMWPWNGVTTPPRPSTAPGGPFPPTDSTPAPGPTPKVQSMLDALAVNGGSPLGYAYDDVPFKLPPAAVA